MPTTHQIFSKMIRSPRSFLKQTILFIIYNIVNGRNLNDTLVEIEMELDLITVPITIDSKEYLTKLRAPVTYKLEDLLMSLAILLILFMVFIIWYFLTSLIIRLAYHKPKARIETIFQEGEECSIC